MKNLKIILFIVFSYFQNLAFVSIVLRLKNENTFYTKLLFSIEIKLKILLSHKFKKFSERSDRNLTVFARSFETGAWGT